MIPDDMALVREFAARQSEPAFAELVKRHLALVHTAALRQTNDAHLAEEITQAVFIILARKASSLGDDTIVPAWLYRTTRFATHNVLKVEHRRRRREQEAYMQSSVLPNDTASAWQQLATLLDDMMDKLSERDRAPLVLRYFENRPWREVADLMQLKEDAAQKRAGRALEKLRLLFAQRGVTLSSTLIAGAVSSHSLQAVPLGMEKTIFLIAATKGTAAAASTAALVNGTLNIMAWVKAKTAVAISAVCMLLAAGTTTVVVSNASYKGPAYLNALKTQSGAAWETMGGPPGAQRVTKLDLFVASTNALRTLTNAHGIESLEFEATDLRVPAFGLISNLTSLKHLSTINCQFLPEQLAAIQNLTNLESLELMFTVLEESKETRAQLLGALTDAETRTRAELKRQHNSEAVIQTALLTDRYLACLSHLEKLKTLKLENTFISGEGLQHLKPLVNLETLYVTPLGLNADTAKPFQAMTKLHSLRYFDADDAVVGTLSTVTSLEDLDIWSGEVTDVGAHDLANLTNLTRLAIRGNHLSDDGLQFLARLPHLYIIDLAYATNISANGIAELQARGVMIGR